MFMMLTSSSGLVNGMALWWKRRSPPRVLLGVLLVLTTIAVAAGKEESGGEGSSFPDQPGLEAKGDAGKLHAAAMGKHTSGADKGGGCRGGDGFCHSGGEEDSLGGGEALGRRDEWGKEEHSGEGAGRVGGGGLQTRSLTDEGGGGRPKYILAACTLYRDEVTH